VSRLSPWERIMRAYHLGTGVRFSEADIAELGRDGAIEQMAIDEANRHGRCVWCYCAIPHERECAALTPSPPIWLQRV
jgi:hypothetical protein